METERSIEPVRFSLARLMLAITAITLLLGFIANRYRIYREISDLHAMGVEFDSTNWLFTPNSAQVSVTYDSRGYCLGGVCRSREMTVEYGRRLEKRIRDLGIERTDLSFSYDPRDYNRTFSGFDKLPNPLE